MKAKSSLIVTLFLAATAAVPQWCAAQVVEAAEPFTTAVLDFLAQ